MFVFVFEGCVYLHFHDALVAEKRKERQASRVQELLGRGVRQTQTTKGACMHALVDGKPVHRRFS
jgi:hypothetical protein